MHKPKISICIPTFNRAKHLRNCLNSIIEIQSFSKLEMEVCVSDNCSTDETQGIVFHAQKSIPIKYYRNQENEGIPRNFLNVVNMASGEFAWLIGDDDLLLPKSLDNILKLLKDNPEADYFFINSYHLTTEYVLSFPQPFSTKDLPKDMAPFSSYKKSGELPFLNLIDPKISFDFLGGMFLAVFRRSKWQVNINVLDQSAIHDMNIFSHFDNTFPQIKIFSKAFANSKAYFHAEPLTVCLTGAREWSPMFPLINSVRFAEALDEYRKNGLTFWQYIKCRNYALSNFIPDMVNMIVHYKSSGFKYINPLRLIIKNCIYPNFYFSLVYFIIRKLRYTFGRVINFLNKV